MKPYFWIVFVAFLGGIAIGETFYKNIAPIIVLVLFVTSCLVVLYLQNRVSHRATVTSVFVAISLIIGVTRSMLMMSSFTDVSHHVLDGNTSGVYVLDVVSVPDARLSSVSLIGALSVSPDHDPILVNLVTDIYHAFRYGDRVTVSGDIKSVYANSKTPEYVLDALKREGVIYEIIFPKIIDVTRTDEKTFLLYIYDLRTWIIATLQRYIPEPASGLVSGLLIGDKDGLSRDWYDRFRDVGLTHIIVLSGYNLTMLYILMRALLFRAPTFIQHAIALGSVCILILLSGAEPPAIRAGLFLCIITLAQLIGRQQQTGHFLSLVVIGMIMVSPTYLLHDISFQLSVVATYGLIYIAPLLSFVYRLPQVIRSVTQETIAAQIAVTPLLLFYFGTFSWVSLFVNSIILPLIPILMILGLVIIVVSCVSSVASLVGIFISIITSYIFSVVLFFSDHADPVRFKINLFVLMLIYGMLIMWVTIKKYQQDSV